MNHKDHVYLLNDGVPDTPNQVWADLGSGGGAFTLALADLLGPTGQIISVDKNARRGFHPIARSAAAGWSRDGKLAALRNGSAKRISDRSSSQVSSSEWTVGVGRIQRRSWQHVGSVSAILSNVGVVCSPHGVCQYKTAGDQTEQLPQRNIFSS